MYRVIMGSVANEKAALLYGSVGFHMHQSHEVP